MTQAGSLKITSATREDVPLILALIGELADYESSAMRQ